MAAADIPAAMRLKNAAGWNQTASDWAACLAASPDGCFVAELQGRVVGTVATIPYEGRVAWIGMVIVEEGLRGRGIGTRLLERAITHLDARRVPVVRLDATPAGRPLYEKHGFAAEWGLERWTLARHAAPATEADDRSAPDGVPQLDRIVELDREAFGADRSALLRAVATAAPELVLAATRDNVVVAGALGRHGTVADHLGPWLALDTARAALLLDEFLRRSGRERIFVDCASPAAVALVRARGFTFSRPLTRMVRGAPSALFASRSLFGVLGPEFG
jgi:predicted N-acetyltransferase YhbS